jgi:hypothetical protein
MGFVIGHRVKQMSHPQFIWMPLAVPRQNSIHLYFQQLRSSFSQSLFFRSKFAEVWGQSRTAVATRSA